MTTPKIGHFILHSNVVPQVTAGKYQLVTEHTGLPFDAVAETTNVTVSAPRYTMPTDQILSTFPPANAEGAFADRLPQVVLKRRTLPWERNPAGQVQPSSTPWLALVVVAEGEAQLSTATAVASCVTPGTTLLDPSDKDVEEALYLAVTESVVKKIFPCQQDLELLTHVRHVDVSDTELAMGDDDGWLAVVLANRLPVFDQANNKAVRYMACLVNIEGQLGALPPPEPFNESFEWALAQDWSALAQIDPNVGPDPRVMGNIELGGISLPVAANVQHSPQPRAGAARTPARAVQAAPAQAQQSAAKVGSTLDGSKSMAQASVSQQWSGMQANQAVQMAARDPDAKAMVRDAMGIGFRLPIQAFAVEKVYRFPVLAHWSFTTNEGATFESLMEDLDVGLLGTVPEVPPEAPPKPGPGPEVVQTGHIGLDHRTRRGDPVRAWYRGPCVPLPTQRDPGQGMAPLAHSADQLRRVVPDGREDLSMASAFEIGRLLALSQLSVVSASMRFRSEQFGAGRVREILAQALPYQLPVLTAGYVDLGRYVAIQAVGEMAKHPNEILGPRRPVADPGRTIRMEGELDAVVAAGLGLDLAALKKTGEQIGMVAALAQSSVPIASKGGVMQIDDKAVTTLRGALQAELGHALSVAMPAATKVVSPTRPRAQRGAAAAAPPTQRDALDELIESAEAQVDSSDAQEEGEQ
ncbi:MAG: hypothetical protein JSS14_11275 [Proteobacteria bacterium]|nr:hypothetical protein [Pseudomonadota bacterium]